MNHPDAAGGRVAVLFGPDGILMVDSQDEELHEKVLKTIRTFSSAPIRILVNSHIHSDHTGGNPFFAKQGLPPVWAEGRCAWIRQRIGRGSTQLDSTPDSFTCD